MRKILVLLLVLSLVLCSGCTMQQGTENPSAAPEKEPQHQTDSDKELFSAVWISYIEISESSGSLQEYESFLDSRFADFLRVGITDVFLQVRPFGDAIYPSELFPSSHTVVKNQGDELKLDYLKVALSKAQQYGLSLHGWINPYRAAFTDDIKMLSDESMAKKGITAEDGSVFAHEGRLYFNPACSQVREQVVKGVRELMQNYPGLEGIHIDDYFYPESCGNFDSADYEAYCLQGGVLSKAQWRRENVNMLIRELYSEVKSFGEDKLFSVSPNGKIEVCTDELYADVELWCTQQGYCDMLLPQLYFGFENSFEPFEQCLEEWTALRGESSVMLVPGLALYKCGKQDTYAGKGTEEWLESSDIIKRQVMLIREKGLEGFALYSGSYVNFSESFYEKELNNLISVL